MIETSGSGQLENQAQGDRQYRLRAIGNTGSGRTVGIPSGRRSIPPCWRLRHALNPTARLFDNAQTARMGASKLAAMKHAV
jgi:hypothetical protein